MKSKLDPQIPNAPKQVDTFTTTHKALGLLILLSTAPDLYVKVNVYLLGVPLLSNSLGYSPCA